MRAGRDPSSTSSSLAQLRNESLDRLSTACDETIERRCYNQASTRFRLYESPIYFIWFFRPPHYYAALELICLCMRRHSVF